MAESAVDDFENISLSDGSSSDLEDDNENAIAEQLDPRVREELECLNSASDEINKLESELELARAKFRSLLTDSSQQMNAVYKKLGRCVNKARPFYELQKKARMEQAEAQRAVVKFQRANSIYRAARETVALAEERLKNLDDGEKQEFDSAWQEMMNHATMKFMESEKEKTRSEQEHLKRAALCGEMQTRLKLMEKDMPRSINKARSYFEMKDMLELRLQQEKLNVEDLQRALTSAKEQYRGALAELESISNEVHQRRKLCKSLPPRTPGVGAELNNDSADLPSINLDVISETSSIISDDQISTDSFVLNGSSSSEASVSGNFRPSSLVTCGNQSSIISNTGTSSSHSLEGYASSCSRENYGYSKDAATSTSVQQQGQSIVVPNSPNPSATLADMTSQASNKDTQDTTSGNLQSDISTKDNTVVKQPDLLNYDTKHVQMDNSRSEPSSGSVGVYQVLPPHVPGATTSAVQSVTLVACTLSQQSSGTQSHVGSNGGMANGHNQANPNHVQQKETHFS